MTATVVRKRFPAAAWIIVAMILGIIVGYMIFISYPDKKTADADRRLHLAVHRHLPAADQDDHRAAGVLDAGRRHRAHGRHQGGRPRVRQGDGLVRLRLAGLAAARPGAVNLLQPGDNLNLPLPDIGAAANLETSQVHAEGLRRRTWCRSRSSRRWRTTRSCRSSCSRCSSASRCAALGEKAQAVVDGIEELSHVMLKITGYVMKLAPLAVFAAMAATVTTKGLGILVNLRHVHGRVLPRPRHALGAADRRRLPDPRPARRSADRR